MGHQPTGDDPDAGREEHRDDTGGEPEEAFVLDEDFIRSAPAKEPAARTRMLQERWRDQPPEPQPWRADKPPAGWFFSKSRREDRKRRRRKGD